MPRGLAQIVGFIMMATLCQRANAQLSPGDLHRSHAFLDGVENCNKCHDRDSDQMHGKCLSCHTEMQARIDRGRGLHAQAEYRECENCHVEHHGRDFDLIYWKAGEKGFDHQLAGYPLQGKHAKTTCRACHKTDFNRDSEQLRLRQKDLSKTYLGLDTSCASCHFDEHRGQLASDCNRCHTFEGWSPAPGFDHDRTKFVLTGRHETTACAKCHQKVEDPSSTTDHEYSRFANVRHENCSNCHKDSHAGRLGSRCEGCHTTTGWQVAEQAGFDHSKTRYPLEGRHRIVACDKCHAAGKPKSGLKFQACRDCHQDHHKGEFADRAQGGACEECHTVAGYMPAQFTIEQHKATRFTLRQAHLALPCVQCHGDAKGNMVAREGHYTWSSMRCQDCHKDVHKGQLARIVERSGCQECHSEASWSAVVFAHDSTGFALTGKHASVNCASCHRGDSNAVDIARLAFAPLRRDCEMCHRDVHRGQFAVADTVPQIRCDRCHTPSNWQATLFDHNKLTEYPLDGAHAKVPCAGCHKPTQDAAFAFVDYHIDDRSCRACHGTDSVTAKGATP